MAKTALGKGLGDLLQNSGARGPATATATGSSAPRLSAGLSTLVHRSANSGTSPAPDCCVTPTLPFKVRLALLAGDAALTAGAFLVVKTGTADAWTISLAVVAVTLGAWIGWQALGSSRPSH